MIVSALSKQRTLIQTKVHFKFCYSVRIETTHKPIKVAAAKNNFSSVYVIDATCFDECFLFHVIAGSHYFWQKFVVTLRFFQPPFCCFLWNMYFERRPYFTYFMAAVQFLQCVCYRCNFLRWMFFIPCDSWKPLFLTKVCRYFEILSTTILLLSLKHVFWKKTVFYVFYGRSTISPVRML